MLVRGAAPRFRDRVVDLAALDPAFSRSLARAARRFAGGSEAALWRLLAARCGPSPIDTRMVAAIEPCSVTRADRVSTRWRGRRRSACAASSCDFAPRWDSRRRNSRGSTRLQATLRALDQSDASISDLASDGGFADQAHATRELRRVTGHTPARLRAELRRDRDGDAAVRLAAAFVRGHAG